jgi:hypothetical protein
MRVKAVVAAIAALVPVVYCGGLVFHFINVGGSVEKSTDIGLGPTMLGLTIVGALFLIPVFFKVAKIFGGPRSPEPGPYGSTPGSEGGIDADAVVARYLAQRSLEAAAGLSSSSLPPRPIQQHSSPIGVSPSKPGGFGRKTR